MCDKTEIEFDYAVIYLDCKNKKANKLDTVNMKVLAIIMLKDNKPVNTLEIENNMIYTVKKI